MSRPQLEEMDHHGIRCLRLSGHGYELRLAVEFGPRVLWLSYQDGPNLLASVPTLTFRTRYGRYHLRGGHRLWVAPETDETYWPDDNPLAVEARDGGVILTAPQEAHSGLRKSLEVRLEPDGPRLVHRLEAERPITCAPWGITQLRPGGVALLPQPTRRPRYLPNRLLVLWPYTRLHDPRLELGDRFVLARVPPVGDPLKIGWANEAGWLGYLNRGHLFLKHHRHRADARYPDLGASAECYVHWAFVELETVGPLVHLEAGQAAEHEETWEVRPATALEEALGGAEPAAGAI